MTIFKLNAYEKRGVGGLVAASASVAETRERRGGRRLQAEVLEGGVQLAADLVEHLLAGDQVVCGHRRHRQRQHTPHDPDTARTRMHRTDYINRYTIPSAMFHIIYL